MLSSGQDNASNDSKIMDRAGVISIMTCKSNKEEIIAAGAKAQHPGENPRRNERMMPGFSVTGLLV